MCISHVWFAHTVTAKCDFFLPPGSWCSFISSLFQSGCLTLWVSQEHSSGAVSFPLVTVSPEGRTLAQSRVSAQLAQKSSAPDSSSCHIFTGLKVEAEPIQLPDGFRKWRDLFCIVSRGTVASKWNKNTNSRYLWSENVLSRLLCQRCSPTSENVSLAAPKLLKSAIKWEW